MVACGGRIINRAGFSASAFWADVDRFGVTVSLLMGPMVSYLAAQPPSPEDRRHPLRRAYLAPVPSDFAAISQRFGFYGMTVFNMTEICSPVHSHEPITAYTASCGRVRPGFECRVVDDEDRPVPPGVAGELVLRPLNPWAFMLGYWHKPEATVAAWRNLWLHTGDACVIDERENIYFVDRLKDAIRRNGENISSMELESIALTHPGIAEVAAVGIPTMRTEDEVKLVVVLRERSAATGEDIADFLRDRLPRYAQPTLIEFVDAIPKTATQKYKKAELRQTHDRSRCWVSPLSPGA
jgi:crotonobetaine/carnitine-CoA ligase